MKPIVKTALWVLVIAGASFAIYKGYKLYQVRKAAKEAAAAQ